MVCLLLGTTGLAVLMTESRTPRIDSDLPRYAFGPISVAMPRQFEEQRINQAASPYATFVDANQQVRLKLTLIDDDQIRPPILALDQAQGILATAAGRSDPTIYQRGPLTVMQSTGYSRAVTRDGYPVQQKHVLAVATVDGSTYLAAELSGFGRLRSSDIHTLLRVVLSAEDDRFAPADDRDLQIDQLSMPRDELLQPLTRLNREGQSNLIYVPTTGRYFFRLPVTLLSVDQLWEQFGKHYNGTPPSDPVKRAIAAVRLIVQVTYLQVHNENPPVNALAEEKINGKPVARLLVVGGGNATGHHERWAMLFDARHIVVIDVQADRRAVKPARSAARWLLANIKASGKAEQR